MAPRYIAASDESALRFERLQTEIGQGPCLSAYESGEAVAVPDLAADDRFPRFGPAAMAAGLAAVFTFPLRHGDGRLGALDLYRDTPGELDPHDMDAAQTLADVAAAYLLNARARDEARATSDRFRHSALHDPLTGLPNRLLLQQRLEHAAQRAKRSHTNAAILFADLDRFKQVNDTHGHQVGDELLLAVAQPAVESGAARRHAGPGLRRRVRVPVRGPAQRGRRRGPRQPHRRGVRRARSCWPAPSSRSRPASAWRSPVRVRTSPTSWWSRPTWRCTRPSARAARPPDHRPARSVQTHDHDSLETDLRSALAEDQLDVAYQPIVRSADGLVTGVEALLRWTHPDRGAVPPLSMVEVAEQSGLISEIGAWVLERSCRDRGRWLHEHPGAPLDLAVNVSARQLMSPDFCATVASVLARTGMDPTALVLEITENIFIEDSERAMTVLADLKGLGVRLALDDFGTGYSSLSYLRRLPIDIVKIDQSFIADIGPRPRGRRHRRGGHEPGARPRAHRHRGGSGDPEPARRGQRHRVRVRPGLLLRPADAGVGDRRPSSTRLQLDRHRHRRSASEPGEPGPVTNGDE